MGIHLRRSTTAGPPRRAPATGSDARRFRARLGRARRCRWRLPGSPGSSTAPGATPAAHRCLAEGLDGSAAGRGRLHLGCHGRRWRAGPARWCQPPATRRRCQGQPAQPGAQHVQGGIQGGGRLWRAVDADQQVHPAGRGRAGQQPPRPGQARMARRGDRGRQRQRASTTPVSSTGPIRPTGQATCPCIRGVQPAVSAAAGAQWQGRGWWLDPDAHVDDDRTVRAGEDRVAVELGDLGVVVCQPADA